MKRLTDSILLLLLALPAFASGDPPLPPLIVSVGVDAGDSPLVTAAKRAVAARSAAGTRLQISIDDRRMRRAGRLSISAAEVPPPEEPAAAFASDRGLRERARAAERQKAADERREAQARLSALQRAREQLAAEEMEPYGGDLSEDEVDLGLTLVPEELDAAEARASSPPPAP